MWTEAVYILHCVDFNRLLDSKGYVVTPRDWRVPEEPMVIFKRHLEGLLMRQENRELFKRDNGESAVFHICFAGLSAVSVSAARKVMMSLICGGGGTHTPYIWEAEILLRFEEEMVPVAYRDRQWVNCKLISDSVERNEFLDIGGYLFPREVKRESEEEIVVKREREEDIVVKRERDEEDESLEIWRKRVKREDSE